jgi:trehalose synthase
VPFSDYLVREIDVPVRDLSRFETLVGTERYDALQVAASTVRQDLQNRTVWNVSSTAAGGGVAEMLQVLIGYSLGANIDMRWLVITGDPDFYSITKRIHNRLHGRAGDGGDLGPLEFAHYSRITSANAASAADFIRGGDVVLLHDPQTAGLALPLTQAGSSVIWRCHIGSRTSNDWTDQAWAFLHGPLAACAAYVFSTSEYIPAWVDKSKSWVIAPSIDPFSPKNQEISHTDVIGRLQHIGLLEGTPDASSVFTRRDGLEALVERRATIVSVDDQPPEADVPWVLQVSRWDRLKDMAGVMTGFASRVVDIVDAQLVLVGPSTSDVTDDPEEAEVFAECTATWKSLPAGARRRVFLVTLPMDDIDENAAMVNAVQRYATVVVQKSLAEGFGLTVAEAMWKAKAVVASNIGGITMQITPGTGLLLEDPTDLVVFGDTVALLLDQPDEIAQLGRRARRHILDNFVDDIHLVRYAQLISWLIAQ